MTEAYLLDTTIASAAGYQGHRLHHDVRAWLDSLSTDAVFVSAVSVAEAEYGLSLVPKEAAIQDDIRRILATYSTISIDHHTAKIYGGIRAILFNRYAPRNRRQGIASKYIEDLREHTSGKQLGIQENDLWIVSVAVQYNLVFVTADLGGGMQRIVEAAGHSPRTKYWP